MPGNHALCTVPINHVKGPLSQLVNANTKKNIAMLYRTGYKKAHYRHLPVVLTQSTLDKYFYLAQRANRRDENCDSILPFALPNDMNV